MADFHGADTTPSPSYEHHSSLLPVITPTASSLAIAPALITHTPSRQMDRRASPTTSCSLNEVVVEISTAVLIPDYSMYFSEPIQQFRPTYYALPDGSLVAPPYLNDVQQGNWITLFTGALLMLFVRNSIVSADYVRRGRVKYKGLFYALLTSQLLGVLSFVIMAASFVAREINCTASLVLQGIFTEISSAILLSGILGVKAYRCLNDSKRVLLIIGLLQLTASVLSITDLFRIQAIRRLSNSCVSATAPRFSKGAVVLRFAIALFICFCFLHALWKSSQIPAARGRISIQLEAKAPPAPGPTPVSEKIEISSVRYPRPRGWWDYVPERTSTMSNSEASSIEADDRGLLAKVRGHFGLFAQIQIREANGAMVQEGAAVEQPQIRRLDSTRGRLEPPSRTPSPSPSNTKSIGRLLTRMKLFREVIKDEMAHTAFVALSNVVSMVASLIGVFAHLPASPTFFIGAYWAVLSLLVISSFGRVVERHEREAMMQNPSTWDPLYKVEEATHGKVRRGISSASVASNPRRKRSVRLPPDSMGTPKAVPNRVLKAVQENNEPDERENPFADFHLVEVPSEAQGASSSTERTAKASNWNRSRAIPPSVPTSPSMSRASLYSNDRAKSILSHNKRISEVSEVHSLSPSSVCSEIIKHHSIFNFNEQES